MFCRVAKNKFVINFKGRLVDALASSGEEGGGRLPKASGEPSNQALIRRF